MLLKPSDSKQTLSLKHVLHFSQVIPPRQVSRLLDDAGLGELNWQNYSARQQSWLNQGLLESCRLMEDLPQLDARLPESSPDAHQAPGDDLPYFWSLLPWVVLEDVLTLWCAWYHLGAISLIINRADLDAFQNLLGDDYEWLMAHGRLHPANPNPVIHASSRSFRSLFQKKLGEKLGRKHRTSEMTDNSHSPILNAAHWPQQKARTISSLLHSVTHSWPHFWKEMMFLKCAVKADTASSGKGRQIAFSAAVPNGSEMQLVQGVTVSPSLMFCLERKYPEWFEWLKQSLQ
ncbi:hypothetical protein C942_02743 [Photobacterium marinum]|uniref:Uncharacterized protein n=1 Tax=Photobacterium marinum TaxID=1056511 RepID=L8JIE3_9GAMM|nr:hypothetical protein [Photobacterium marinum]ELR67234.1 hypothetical protein C942_02743 [Photobacterium marinum]